MSASAPLLMSVVLGIDCGGSRTRARLSRSGGVIAEIEGGSSNPAAVGEAKAHAELKDLFAKLPSTKIDSVCLGAAGSGSIEFADRIREFVRGQLPGVPVLVVNDARIVLAATSYSSGIALIAGTGTIAYGIAPDGNEARAGGWGYLFGDEGGGYWVVREAVKKVLWRYDQGRSASSMAQALLRATGLSRPIEFIHAFHERNEPAAWARFASVVFKAATEGDREAAAIVAAASRRLASLAAVVAKRLEIQGPVVLAGGLLLGQGQLERGVRSALGRRLPGSHIVRLAEPPVAGAVRLAEGLLQDVG